MRDSDLQDFIVFAWCTGAYVHTYIKGGVQGALFSLGDTVGNVVLVISLWCVRLRRVVQVIWCEQDRFARGCETTPPTARPCKKKEWTSVDEEGH